MLNVVLDNVGVLNARIDYVVKEHARFVLIDADTRHKITKNNTVRRQL